MRTDSLAHTKRKYALTFKLDTYNMSMWMWTENAFFVRFSARTLKYAIACFRWPCSSFINSQILIKLKTRGLGARGQSWYLYGIPYCSLLRVLLWTRYITIALKTLNFESLFAFEVQIRDHDAGEFLRYTQYSDSYSHCQH